MAALGTKALLAVVGLGTLAMISSSPPPPAPKPDDDDGPAPKPKPKPKPPPKPKDEPPLSGDFWEAVGESFSDAWRSRLLEGARTGRLVTPGHVSIVSRGQGPLEGYVLHVDVESDARMIDGHRPISDLVTAQQIADIEGNVMLLTPWMMGLVSEQTTHIAPVTMTPNPNARKTNTLKADARITAAKQRAGASAIDNAGKVWVLTRNAWAKGSNKVGIPYSRAAFNFGLFTAPWQPIQTLALGASHGWRYADYSQMLRYMRRAAKLMRPDKSAEYVDLAELVRNSELAALVTGPRGKARGRIAGEGALPSWRQPAIPPPA